MANTNAPRGFKPRRQNGGGAWTGVVNQYPIASGYATSIYYGDPVKLLTTGLINKAGVSDQMRGVFIGVKYQDGTNKLTQAQAWTASTATYGAVNAVALVIDDPNVVFEAQFTNSTSVPVQADCGATFSAYDAGGSAATGVSGMGVDYSTINTTALPWRFLSFVTRPDNDTASAYSYGLFVPALHDFRVNTGI